LLQTPSNCNINASSFTSAAASSPSTKSGSNTNSIKGIPARLRSIRLLKYRNIKYQFLLIFEQNQIAISSILCYIFIMQTFATVLLQLNLFNFGRFQVWRLVQSWSENMELNFTINSNRLSLLSNVPGMAQSKNETHELTGLAKLVDALENNFDSVAI
ncbi:hypothetical protein ALC56_03388, partial [Trachymyrmex septentrionalis]